METLADFGVSSYFGIQTFTAGIYKAWLVMDNRLAAAQLATVLLLIVAALLAAERATERRMRFASAGLRPGSREAQPTALTGARAALAWALCAAPIALGFVLPVLFMTRPLTASWTELTWAAFARWSLNSVWLAAVTALLATAIAVLLAYGQRRHGGHRWCLHQHRYCGRERHPFLTGHSHPGRLLWRQVQIHQQERALHFPYAPHLERERSRTTLFLRTALG
jgi:iron(III) transport system permease protein